MGEEYGEAPRRPNPTEKPATNPFAPPPIHVGGQAFAGGDAEPQRGEVESILCILHLEHGRIESWNAKEQGGAVPLKDLKHSLRRGPARIQDRLRADAHREIHVVAETIREKQLRRDRKSVV